MAKRGYAIKVVGLKALQSDLRGMDKSLSKGVRAFNKEAAQIVADEAKQLAPVGPTGRLKNSIMARGGMREATIKIGSKARVPYAGPVIGGRRGYNKPNPFPFVALKRKRRQLHKIYDSGINRLVKKLNR